MLKGFSLLAFSVSKLHNQMSPLAKPRLSSTAPWW